MGPVQELGQARLEGRLQEDAGHVQVTGLGQEAVWRLLRAQGGDEARVGEDGPVPVWPAEDDAEARGLVRDHQDPGGVDAPLLHGGQHEVAEDVVPALAHEGHPQTQPGRAHGQDHPGGAHGEGGLLHQFLRLAEGGLHVSPQDQVRVDLPYHQEVVGAWVSVGWEAGGHGVNRRRAG